MSCEAHEGLVVSIGVVEEKIKNCCDKLDCISIKLDDLTKTMNGNGKLGIAHKAQEAYNYMEHAKRSKNGWLDWLFRSIILLGMTAMVSSIPVLFKIANKVAQL